MPRATIVHANGAAIPRIGLGTWPMMDDECVSAVATALAVGYRHIDTARRYGNERFVGEGLRAGGVPRGEIFLTTKVWPDKIAPGDLQASAEASLKDLGLDYVDLLLIHWPNPSVPLEGSIKALVDAKRRGLARHIGISNFPTKLIEQAVALSSEPLVCNQVEYHPHLDQSKVMAACTKHGLAMVSFCPLGRGSIGGVMDERVIKEIAAARGKTPGQIVLAWHVAQPGVVAVPKSANPQRIAENLDVFDINLTADEMARISGLAHPEGRVVRLDIAPEWD